MATDQVRKRVPRGTVSDVDEGSGLLGSDVQDLSALFMTVSSHSDADAGPRPFGEDEPATSGVLDIRALADAYETELERRRGDTQDEPPMVTETGLGLLMPKPEPEVQRARPRIAIWALGALVLVAATAVVTAFVVHRTMKPALAAAAPSAEQCADLMASQAVAAMPPAAAEQVAPAAAAVAPIAVPTEVEPLEEEAAEPEPPAVVRDAVDSKPEVAVVDEDAETRRARREERRERREREQAEPAVEEPARAAEPNGAAVAAAPVVEPVEPAPAAEPEPAAKAAGECDEVACLVDPSSACCAQRSPKVAAKVAETTEELPERLSASDVNAGLRPRRGRIESCGDRHGFTGTANLKLVITPAGKVGSVELSEGNSAFQSCVAGHVKKASFERSQRGMSLTYPLVFR